MYKLKPSLLESYRIYKADIFNKELDELISEIKDERKPDYKMSFGSLIHRYLESGKTSISVDFKLKDEEISQLKPIYEINKTYLREVRFKYSLINDILISGIIDSVYGTQGIEYKTGNRFYGVDFYENSIQWKIYCDALNLNKFTYIHIQIKGTNRPYLFEIRDFSFYYNQNMKNEILSISNEFIEFCKIQNIENYINE